jgi:ATP-dependent helicase/nuclease subunit B
VTLPPEEDKYPRQTRLFLEPLDQSRQRLWSLVAELKGSDPLIPVTVAGPSTYALLSLRHALGRQGMANVRFMLLPRLTELLGAPALAARGLRPLTPILESAAVRAAAAEALGPLESLWEHPSLHRTLGATFRELRYATAEALTKLETRDEVWAEVIRLYHRFRERAASYYDREALAQSAAEAVRAGAARGLDDLGAIIFYLVRDLTPGERALVEELARRWDCFAVLGVTGDAEADAGVRALLRGLAPVLGTPHESSCQPDSAESHLVIAPDAAEEVRWVVRRIMKGAQEGAPFHRMAVLYPQPVPYASLLRDQLALAGVRTCGPGVIPLADTAVGRTLQGLVSLAGSQYSRDAIMEWLTGCPVAPPGVPSPWDAVSRRAGVVKGLEQWRERLERYAFRVEHLATERAGDEELSAAEEARLHQEAKDARVLAAFMVALGRRAHPPEDGQSWREFSRWAQGLLTRYLNRSTALPSSEEALEHINDALAELESLDELEPGPSLAYFNLALDEALTASVGHQGRFGQGIFVAPQRSALGMEFDRVYLVGLVEGAVPPRISNDPLVPDQERRAAGGPDSGLPLRGTRQEDERYGYLAALGSAPSRILSFPRGNPGAQRGQYPSRWFLEEASRLHGSPVFSTTLADLGKQPWLATIASREEGLSSAEQLAPADSYDYDLHRLWQWRSAGRPIEDHHLAASEEILARALDLERSRANGLLTRWDGDLSVRSGQSRWLRLAERSVLSATSLQTWAACPFRYFVGHVLRLGSLGRPEEPTRIPALDKGTLVHAILEQFIRQTQQENTLPAAGELWREEHRVLLQGIAR